MPINECDHCGSSYAWSWTEAFEKFGFNDGEGQIMTGDVADVLRAAGYVVDIERWGLHNTVIVSIKEGARELIDFDKSRVGYDAPHCYLPESIVALLDREFPDVG